MVWRSRHVCALLVYQFLTFVARPEILADMAHLTFHLAWGIFLTRRALAQASNGVKREVGQAVGHYRGLDFGVSLPGWVTL